MISHDPDMTRLLDRMEKRGLITRERQTDDRRVVKTRITPQALRLLKTLDQPVHELHKRQFRHMPLPAENSQPPAGGSSRAQVGVTDLRERVSETQSMTRGEQKWEPFFRESL